MILSIVPTNSYAREKSLEQFPLFWRDLPRALSKYLPGENTIDLETVVPRVKTQYETAERLRDSISSIGHLEWREKTPQKPRYGGQ